MDLSNGRELASNDEWEAIFIAEELIESFVNGRAADLVFLF